MVQKILVTGISGQQGGATARALLVEGKKFRGLSRSPDKLKAFEQAGVEIVKGDLGDSASLEKALQGVDSAFLVTTWFEGGVDVEVEQGKNFVDAAKAAGVKHLVFSSVAAADEGTGIPHFESKWQIEEHLQQSGLPWTILRPVWFMENFGVPWFRPAIQGATVVLPIKKETQLHMVALETIGRFGAAALTRPEAFLHKALTLASDCLTLPHAMELIGKATGREIQYEELPETEAETIYGPDLAKMYAWFNEKGYTDKREELRPYGIPLPTFEEHLRSASWLEGLRQAVAAS